MTRPEQSGERRCPEPDARGGKNWVLGVTALASFMMVLDGQVITTAFATIRGEFGASVETLQWTVNGYNLTFAVLLLTGAALGDRFGRRAMFAAGIFLFTLASMACALSGAWRPHLPRGGIQLICLAGRGGPGQPILFPAHSLGRRGTGPKGVNVYIGTPC